MRYQFLYTICASLMFSFCYVLMLQNTNSMQKTNYFYNLSHFDSNVTKSARKHNTTTQIEIRLFNNTNLTVNVVIAPDPNHCSSSNVRLVLFLLSKPANVEFRQAVRNTWASHERLSSYNFSLIFVLSGASGLSQKALKGLRQEHEQNGDLLLLDLHESYAMLQRKTAAAVTFLAQECTCLVYLKTDDNVMVSLERADQLLRSKVRPHLSTIHGLCRSNAIVMREGKWAIPVSVWRHPHLPQYCLGGAQLITRTALTSLVHHMHLVPEGLIEDVWLTGFVAEVAHVRRLSIEPAQWTSGDRSRVHPCNVGQQLAYHRAAIVSPETITEWWHQYEKLRTVKCNRTEM